MSRASRNGIFILIGVVVCVQVAVYFYLSKISNTIPVDSIVVESLEKEIDSIQQEKEFKRIAYLNAPFNPNFISDYKGAQLGMTLKQIDRLHAFREKGNYINSVKDFKDVTKIQDSILNTFKNRFKFPAWTQKSKRKKKFEQRYTKSSDIIEDDINKVAFKDLKNLKELSYKKINAFLNYRKKLQGYSHTDQLSEIWGFNDKDVNLILKHFKFKSKPTIKKTNINNASFKEILKTPYIDYELTKKIVSEREYLAEFQSLEELLNIEGFPKDKYDRIILYLTIK